MSLHTNPHPEDKRKFSTLRAWEGVFSRHPTRAEVREASQDKTAQPFSIWRKKRKKGVSVYLRPKEIQRFVNEGKEPP